MGQDCSKILTNAGGGAGRPPCPSDDVDAKGAEIACARRSRLAMDWADGAMFKDFLGFAILRSPGFHLGEKDGYSSTRSASRLRDPFAVAAKQRLAYTEVFVVGFRDYGGRPGKEIHLHGHARARHWFGGHQAS